MSADNLALLAFLGALLLIGALWRAARRRDRTPPIPVRARARQIPERVVTVAEALAGAVEDLETAKRLLDDVDTIGLWNRSDDSSDNRRRRDGLRETDWAVSGAQREVASIPAHLRNAQIDALEADLRSLVAKLEPLPDTVTDTMGDNLSLDYSVQSLSDEVERLREQASRLAADAAGDHGTSSTTPDSRL